MSIMFIMSKNISKSSLRVLLRQLHPVPPV